MESSPPRRTDAQVLSVARALWSALLVSLIMYVLIAFQMGRTGTPGEAPGRLEVVLKICAVGSFFFAYLLPRLFARLLVLRRSTGTGPSLAEKFPPYLLRLVLFEAVALFGFVLAVRTSSGAKLWPFLTVAALGFLTSFPSKQRLEAL